MEPQQQQQANDQNQGGKNTTPYLCRQSSTRWTPTTDQIRILKDLYYNNGLRSPSAEQIQRISAKLRQYGKIEGKNVFYWFQNHKARERQKKRFTADMAFHKPVTAGSPMHNKFPNINPYGNFPSSSASNSSGLLSAGNGSVAVEKSFRYCSIPNPNSGWQNYALIGVDPYTSHDLNFLEKRKNAEETLEMEEEEEAPPPEIETLPLFPMQGDVTPETDYFGGWCSHTDDGLAGGSRASMELTLNSYAGRFPSS